MGSLGRVVAKCAVSCRQMAGNRQGMQNDWQPSCRSTPKHTLQFALCYVPTADVEVRHKATEKDALS